MTTVRLLTMPDGTQRATCGHKGHDDTVQRYGQRTCPLLGPVCILDDQGRPINHFRAQQGCFNRESCGCHIDGTGIIPDPYRVHRCKAHGGDA